MHSNAYYQRYECLEMAGTDIVSLKLILLLDQKISFKVMLSGWIACGQQSIKAFYFHLLPFFVGFVYIQITDNEDEMVFEIEKNGTLPHHFTIMFCCRRISGEPKLSFIHYSFI